MNYLNTQREVARLKIYPNKNNKIRVELKSIERTPKVTRPELTNLYHALQRKNGISLNEIKSRTTELQHSLDDFIQKYKKQLILSGLLDKDRKELELDSIIEFGRKLNEKPKFAVLLFTNKTRYRNLIQKVHLNGKDINESFTTAEIRFSRKQEPEIVKSGLGIPVVYFCSIEYLLGWSEIKRSLGLDNVNTLVFDDFDEYFKREKRLSEPNLKILFEELRKAQSSDEIKDVYLLQKNTSYQNEKEIENYHKDIYPWLVNREQRRLITDDWIPDSPFLISKVSDEAITEILKSFKIISTHLRNQLRTNYNVNFKYELLSTLKEGYNLIDRLNSFYSPSHFYNDFKAWVESLFEIQDGLDSFMFKSTINQLIKDLDIVRFPNKKVDEVVKFLDQNVSLEELTIVSKNTNNEDKEYLAELIKSTIHMNLKYETLDDYDMIEANPEQFFLILNINDALLNSLYLNPKGRKHLIFVESEFELSYLRYHFDKNFHLINSLSNPQNKLLLLNLESQEHLLDQGSIDANLQLDDLYIKKKETLDGSSDVSGEFTRSDTKDPLEFFQFSFEWVIDSVHKDTRNHSPETIDQNYTYIILDDRVIRERLNKQFYVFDEDSDDLKVKASELKSGDHIFLLDSFNDDFNELIEYLAKSNSEIKHKVTCGQSWQRDLVTLYEQNGGYYDAIQNIFRKKGLDVVVPTIANWLSGSTVLPDSIEDLISILRSYDLPNTSRFDSSEIIQSAKWLISFRIKLRKETYQYHVYRKCGMRKEIQSLELVQIIEQLDKLLELKEVLATYRI